MYTHNKIFDEQCVKILESTVTKYPWSNKYKIAMAHFIDSAITNVLDKKCQNGCLWGYDRPYLWFRMKKTMWSKFILLNAFLFQHEVC